MTPLETARRLAGIEIAVATPPSCMEGAVMSFHAKDLCALVRELVKRGNALEEYCIDSKAAKAWRALADAVTEGK